jgi:hypothetical protein
MRGLAHVLRDVAIVAALVLPAVGVAPQQASSAPDLRFQPIGYWNGKKIYLSPARHRTGPGAQGECGDRTEDYMAFGSAWHATNGVYFDDRRHPNNQYRNLRSRHYKVRIHRGPTVQTAIYRSNEWGSTRHIPIHSNAITPYPNHCLNTDKTRWGTIGIYRRYNVKGKDLATKLTETIGTRSDRGLRISPGTNDHICYNPGEPCTQTDLGELREMNMPAAYMEMEFHTWQRGYNFVAASEPRSWRIGWGVDWHLGWPRR